MKIALVADSHLAPDADACNRNWSAVDVFIRESRADLTIHLGDITVDGLGNPDQFGHALAVSSSWATPIRYLPGNHDIGDNPPGPGVAAKHPLELSRVGEFRTHFGPDYWGFDAEGWCVVGLNAQLFGTDTSEEAEQWRWLTEALAGGQALPVILLVHKPLFQNSPADATPHQRIVPVAARRRLLEMLANVDLRVVMSGHTHQYRDRVVDDVRHIWVPSTAFYLPDEIQERIGEKITGLGMLDLSRGSYRFHLVCPEGVARHSALDHPLYPEIIAARARLGKLTPP